VPKSVPSIHPFDRTSDCDRRTPDHVMCVARQKSVYVCQRHWGNNRNSATHFGTCV